MLLVGSRIKSGSEFQAIKIYVYATPIKELYGTGRAYLKSMLIPTVSLLRRLFLDIICKHDVDVIYETGST